MANHHGSESASELSDDAATLEGFARYALFWAPRPGEPLARAGAAWLGWDPATGEAAAARADDPRIKAPRRYGLHATLKAPFRLAPGAEVAALDKALQTFAAARAPAVGPGLMLDDGLGFMALRPMAASPAIDALAGDCVTVFDHFRAPLTEEDRRRRGADRLSPRERALLEAHGYPYILDRFRFHITLTGRLKAGEAAETALELNDRFGGFLTPAFRIDAIALFGDPGSGAGFRLLRHYALTG
ncbi:MAG: DUF1045 domain-containing protein [Pseudomonadota bacterium]